jgi:hypothetical protein
MDHQSVRTLRYRPPPRWNALADPSPCCVRSSSYCATINLNQTSKEYCISFYYLDCCDSDASVNCFVCFSSGRRLKLDRPVWNLHASDDEIGTLRTVVKVHKLLFYQCYHCGFHELIKFSREYENLAQSFKVGYISKMRRTACEKFLIV